MPITRLRALSDALEEDRHRCIEALACKGLTVNINEGFSTLMPKILDIKGEPLLPILPAPTLSLYGIILSITDEYDLATSFDILVDGEVVANVVAESGVPDEPENPEHDTSLVGTWKVNEGTRTLLPEYGIRVAAEGAFPYKSTSVASPLDAEMTAIGTDASYKRFKIFGEEFGSEEENVSFGEDGNIYISHRSGAIGYLYDTIPELQKFTITGIDTTDSNYQAVKEWIIRNAVKEGNITFTIDGTTYQAEEGMTWQEWVDSEYNTGAFYVGNSVGWQHVIVNGETGTNSDGITGNKAVMYSTNVVYSYDTVQSKTYEFRVPSGYSGGTND